jgi:hypothetical protein
MTDEPDAILAIKIVLNEKLNSKLIPLLIHLLVESSDTGFFKTI